MKASFRNFAGRGLVLVLIFFLNPTGFAQNNVVKLGVSGANYGDFSLSYERMMTNHSSLNITGGYWNLNASLFNFSGILAPTDGITLKQFNEGFHASVDYRFYVGKKEAPRGMYIGPYIRYWQYSLLALDEIEGDLFDVDTRIGSIGAGFQMGYHWLIRDCISIDWFFIGLGVESISSRFVYITQTPGFDYSTIVDDFVNVFEGFDYFQNKIKTTSGPENMTANLPFLFPGIKTGITIGYSF
ncbi:MAG TPA: DUF3575 domain-containing protein [Prolixibacteraceae bacterium]|nr:DUF3575 domain-containing protein [Prolixibacteraceae bacterium]